MNTPTPEQLDIINHPLERICVSAGAGSGKTETIVRRVIELQKKITEQGARIAVLSFTNIAVETFTKVHRELSAAESSGTLFAPVEFATLDSFLFRNILKPHGHLSMGCSRAPFLVHGTEPFLEGMKFKHRSGSKFIPLGIDEIHIGYDGTEHVFFYSYYNDLKGLDTATGLRLVKGLASHGGYTVQSGRYWALRTLLDKEFVRRAFVNRYPEIIVDEAQDIGLIHDEILNCLNKNGSQISLFGDSNQSIYEFNNADGSHLKHYGNMDGVTEKELQINWRSVPSIVIKANSLSGRKDASGRSEPSHLSGAFFITYPKANEASAIDKVLGALPKEIPVQDFAVLCRSHAVRIKTSGQDTSNCFGEGCTKAFATAALRRDEILAAGFREFVATVAKLIDKSPNDFVESVLKSGSDDAYRHVRQRLWAFYRDTKKGLPGTGMKGQSEWQPALIANLRDLLPSICDAVGGSVSPTLGNKVSRKRLSDEPIRVNQASEVTHHRPRIDTIHGAKGESIGGVVYIATKPQAQAMLNGCDTEDGRIGYVALTRAKNLFVLAIPEASLSDLQADLDRHGFLPLPPPSDGINTI